MKEKKQTREVMSWTEHPVWLEAFQQPIPENLATPAEIAAFEAERFAGENGKNSPSFCFVPDETLGESYILERYDPGRITVRGGEQGILYGTYEALFDLICEKPLPKGIQTPAYSLRMLDSWDNPDGTIERGYAGRSLWFEGGCFSYDPVRIRQLGRMLASTGINVLCINNVNVDESARSLIGDLLPETAGFARLLRPFGIRLMISVDFSSPMATDNANPDAGRRALRTADPLDEEVGMWWKNCAARVYQAIPDLAGNCWEVGNQPEIVFGQMSEYDKEFLKNYGYQKFADFVNPPIELAPYGEAWQIDYTPVDIAHQDFLDIQDKTLPELIMCDPAEFDARWDAFVEAITPSATEFGEYMWGAVKAEAAKVLG